MAVALSRMFLSSAGWPLGAEVVCECTGQWGEASELRGGTEAEGQLFPIVY